MQISGVVDAVNDPYGRRFYARKKRVEFEKFKRTKEFQSWRRIQLRAQKEQCAYCRVKLTKSNIVTHVDHVSPLYHEGTNVIDNLVLTCRRCNLRKYTSNRYVYPEWIKDNKRKHRIKKMRKEQRKLMNNIIKEEMEQQLAYELGQMFQ